MAASVAQNRQTASKAPKAAVSRRSRAGGTARAAQRLPPPNFSENLWKKLAVYAALIGAPCAAFLLAAFVWQLHTALDHIAAPEDTMTAQAQLSAALPDSETSTGSISRKPLTFGQFPPAGHKTAAIKAKAFDSNLQFVHHGIMYSSLLVLAASMCAALLLAHFMAQDKRHRRSYQTLLVNADTELEHRLRHRTAHLQAARHLAEKERQRAELLLQDTSHRVGNSLATVSSLLGLQLRQCRDEQVRKALLSARDRIQSISAAHRRLRLNADMETAAAGDFLAAIIRDVENGLPAKSRSHITIETRFEQWYLPARDVTTLGIILGELLTNAVKHAFPAGRKGKITVTFGKFSGRHLRLSVEDNGIGLPPHIMRNHAGKPAPEQGLGRLIIMQLAMQFDAKPQFAAAKHGGSRITIPLLNTKADKINPAEEKRAA